MNLLRDLSESDILLAGVSYIFYGEREQDLAEEKINLDYDLKFSSGEVRIFKVQD